MLNEEKGGGCTKEHILCTLKFELEILAHFSCSNGNSSNKIRSREEFLKFIAKFISMSIPYLEFGESKNCALK